MQGTYQKALACNNVDHVVHRLSSMLPETILDSVFTVQLTPCSQATRTQSAADRDPMDRTLCFAHLFQHSVGRLVGRGHEKHHTGWWFLNVLNTSYIYLVEIIGSH